MTIFAAKVSPLSVWLALSLALMLYSARAGSQLTVGTNAGFPDTTVPLTNQFAGDPGVVALQYDVLFDGGKLTATGATGGDALLDHNIYLGSPGPGTNRVLVHSSSNTPLSNGVLAQLYFAIASNAPVGTTAVTFTNGLAANANAQALSPVSYVPGSLTITAGPARLGSVTRGAGGLVQFQVSGSVNGAYVIEASDNLVNWLPVSTNTAIGGLIQLQDNDSTIYPRRFYRAIVKP